MALDKVNKKVQTEAVTPTPQQTDAGTSSVKSSQKPIDFKSKTDNSNQQSEIVDYINSDEFKNLPKAEQLKQLKAKFPFMKDFSSEEITSYVNAAKESVENKKTTEQKTDTITETSEKSETKNQNELEKLALEYKQKNNIKGEIDEVIADLKTKEKSGAKLSADEKKLLKLYDQPKEETQKDSKLVVPMQTLLSKEFRDLSPEEKLKTITTAYLEKNDKKYQSLSDKEKEAYLAEKMNDITNMVIDKNDKSKNKIKKAEMRALSLIQAAYEDGKTVDDLKKLSAEERTKLITRTENKVIKDIITHVNKNLPKNASYADKIEVYTETLLTMADPDYQNIKDPEAKKNYRQKTIDTFIAENFDIKNWARKTPEEKEKIILRAALTIEHIVETTGNDGSIIDNIKNFKALPKLEQNRANLKYLNAKGNLTEEEQKIKQGIQDRIIIYERLEKKGIHNPTDKQFAQEVRSMGNAAPESLKRKLKAKDRGNKMGGVHVGMQDANNKEKAALEGTTLKKKLHKDLNNCTNSDEYILVVKEYNEKADSIEELEEIRQAYIDKLIAKGYKPEVAECMANDSEVLPKLYCFAQNSKDFNKITEESVKTPEGAKVAAQAHKLAPKWFEDKNEVAEIGIHTLGMDIKPAIKNELNKAYTEGLHDNLSKEDNKIIFNKISSSKMVPAGAMADFTKTFIQTAHNDNDRVYYSKTLSTIKNPAVTEGLAAGAKYVTTPAAKQQYTHYVEVAARNYPPETQAAIKTALKTGEITPQTLAKTTVSETPQQHSNNKTTSSETPTNTQDTRQTSTTQDTPLSDNSGVVRAGTEIFNESRRDLNSTVQSTTNPITGNHSTVKTNDFSSADTTRSKSTSTTNTTTNSYNKKIENDYKTSEEKANLQLKETTLENIAEVKEKIDNSIKEWELKQATKLSDEDIEAIKALAAGDAIDDYIKKHPTEREVIIENLSKAQSINEVYNILVSALGSKVHDKFIEVLASYGSANSIRSFVNSKTNDTDIIKKMYLRCNSEGLKNELLNLLPESTIREMLEKGDITTLDAVDHKIMYSFILKNLYSMTSTSFANYLKYLPLDERKHLTELRNQSLNLTPQNQTEQAFVPNSTQTTSPQPVYNSAQQPNKITPQPAQNDKQNNNVDESKPMFTQGETVKTLANGTVITNQGTTFAGVSNNTYDEFRVVNDKPQKKEGAPIGMNDEVLTPGSEEWKRKYNKQQEAPATAFTMAAMTDEDDDDFGMPFGSTKVGMGQKIKKKYPSKNFRFNA